MMRHPVSSLLLGFLVAILLASTTADAQDGWVPDKFRRLFSHASIVVDDTLYIVGGEIHLQDGNDVHVTALDSTLSIPLNASWTNSSVDIKANHYPQGFPYLNAQNLWWDPNSKSINSYGGGTTIAGNEGADEVDPLSVWAFKPEDNSWSERYAPDDDLWDTMTRATRCASAYTPKSGYCLGGYSGPWSTDINTPTTNIPLGGMVEFDFETATWSNVSSVGSSQRGWTISQQMEYLPSYGKKGVLVAIGGHDLPEQEEHEDGKDLRSMANITIYDINTSTWHSQNATGDIPYGRTKFCSVAVQGGNNDTYEIYVFGGNSGSTSSDSDQVYILSLPAFRWFRTPATTQPRYMHTCEFVGNRQMLSIGGAHPQKSDTIDPFDYGLGIFDMVDWEWKPGYDAKASPYEPADTIREFYEKNPRYPEWETEGVKALIQNSTDPPPADPPSDEQQSEPPAQDPQSSTPVGAIVGGVIGGVGGLAIIAAVIFFLLQRQRRKTRDHSPESKELESSTDSSSHARTPIGGPGELDSSEPYPIMKDNTHPRSWGGRVKELEGHERQRINELEAERVAQEHYNGLPVRVQQGGVTELES